ncbi:MAG TPA: galactose oxidase-like domain-containing protein [Micromonosporaceae bacterium]|nr:galactose oxidase-like domain-containing protein [Micromonosporaceae bacterium]
MAGSMAEARAAETHQDGRGARNGSIDAPTHRRILDFINAATRPEDLMVEKVAIVGEGGGHGGHGGDGEGGDGQPQPRALLEAAAAQRVIELRDREFPLGLRHLREATDAGVLDTPALELLARHFGRTSFGEWRVFPQPVPRRGPGGYDGVIHAALLRTGKVLFITADETTLLWDPQDTSAATFEDPVNQPHLMPGGYSQLCGHHVFLSDGRLLSVGGGGYGHNALARWGYTFDPETRSWSRTAGPMSDSRWYPTAVSLGGEPGRVLVVCGHGHGQMDIYDESTDDFTPLSSGDTKMFPYLYPGLHLLPNRAVFYSRTGWGGAGPGGGPYPGGSDDQSSYFTLTGPASGVWADTAPFSPAEPDRTKGMSVLLLSKSAPYAQVMVVGGSDISTNHTYELADVTSLSPATDWGPPLAFPDGAHRSLASTVLLPDGSVFVCGGIQQTNSPCARFDPQTGAWSSMAALPSVRDYHSVALLLPSGEVMMAGWNSTAVEIFSPPYLFRGARPVISSAPDVIHRGQDFVVETPPPEGKSVAKVVLVRPMAVTHQTDTEQKVVELDWAHNHDHAHPKKLRLRAPNGGASALAQRGYYMMFLVNDEGVPSVAKWVYLR